MSDEQIYDYSNFGSDWLDFGFRLSDVHKKELQAISSRIAEEHGIANSETHVDLVFKLWRIMGRQSRTYLDNGSIKIAADVEPLKSVTENVFPKLDKLLSEAVEILHEATGNEVFRTILLDAAEGGGDPGDQVSALFGLAETVAKAAEFKGKPGKRRRPDWVKNFCLACQAFWYSNDLGGTKLNYKATTPPAIVNWLEQIFKELRDYRKQVDHSFNGPRCSSLGTMRKVAQDLPAFRPPNEGETGG